MSLWSAVGNTPLVELTNLENGSGVKIFGKLEGSNPDGEVDVFVAGMGTGGTLMGTGK